MATLTVEKLHDTERNGAPILRELETILDRTQRRAFDLFTQRGGWPGADLDDWLRAEREIAWCPESELTENDREIRIQVAAPGLDMKQIHVTALPESIIVKGDAIHKHQSTEGSVQFCESERKSAFPPFRAGQPYRRGPGLGHPGQRATANRRAEDQNPARAAGPHLAFVTPARSHGGRFHVSRPPRGSLAVVRAYRAWG